MLELNSILDATAVRTRRVQMVGRGTRLCPNVFGPSQGKENFLIFDLCRNIEYLNQDVPISNAAPAKSLSERLFAVRAELLADLDHQQAPGTRPAEIADVEPVSTLDLWWQLPEELFTEGQIDEIETILKHIRHTAEPEDIAVAG